LELEALVQNVLVATLDLSVMMISCHFVVGIIQVCHLQLIPILFSQLIEKIHEGGTRVAVRFFSQLI